MEKVHPYELCYSVTNYWNVTSKNVIGNAFALALNQLCIEMLRKEDGYQSVIR